MRYLGRITDDKDLVTKEYVDNSIPSLTAYAPLASPTFTGIPAAPTASTGTNTTQLATTAFVQQELSSFSAGVAIAVQSAQPSGQSSGDFWYQVT